MLKPLVSWIFSPSSSSSSSSEEEEEEEEEESFDINNEESDYENYENDNVEDQLENVDNEEKNNFLSPCDVDDALEASDAIPAVTVALPAPTDDTNIATTSTATTIATRSTRQRNNKYSGGVRQYQRLWTKQDEMELLKGYLDYIKQQGRTATTLQSDVASFYDQVMPKFNTYFNKNQLVDKLRRLKRKHKMVLDKSKEVQVSFKIPHEQAIFEISHKIWGNDTDHDVFDVDESRHVSESPDLIDNVKMKNEYVDDCEEMDKRPHKRMRLTTDDVNTKNDQNYGDVTSIHGFIEETMRSCFPPLLKELLDDASVEPLGALPMMLSTGEARDEQWLKRRILELEVYLNRLELLQGQIKARLEELKSSLD
ncbi:hypothetical protein L195_g020615 [Trifolium pratense]|uniref:Glabrous enhancer-binding protein-like DBD domain-containing protein n=1 Tax=Trifolium pratense TaxID=57577 RepID=A0A2K3N2Z2_TRIPR|nr:hypothetical protein L195_g020615 [Trifolium pratense]